MPPTPTTPEPQKPAEPPKPAEPQSEADKATDAAKALFVALPKGKQPDGFDHLTVLLTYIGSTRNASDSGK